MNREQQLAEAFVDLTDTLARDVEPLTLLHRLTRHSLPLTGMDDAGVLLANARGDLRTAATTDDRPALTGLLTSQILRGPGADAYRTNVPVHAPVIREGAAQWPEFATLASSGDYAGAHALPLRVHGQAVGALSLLSHEPRALAPERTALVQALADVAVTAVLTWSSDPLRPADIVTRMQSTLSAKALLDTAAGMLAATGHIQPYEAARQLHAYAARTDLRPAEVADQLVRRLIEPSTVLARTP
ncbi:GAF and ANTAR domain-containing protein [Streptomyces sp. NPDC091416]|uniref:GAF and ANTAR domain-containing protein n=1 Tax=Streptomyces sp. NPDC091416 TaxID=3366003 RepID=UPI0038160F73